MPLALDAAASAEPERPQADAAAGNDDDDDADGERELTVTDWNPPPTQGQPQPPSPHAPESESAWPDPAAAETHRPEGRREPSFDGASADLSAPRPDPAQYGASPRNTRARFGQHEESLLRAASAPADDVDRPAETWQRQAAPPANARPAERQRAGEAAFTPSFLRTADHAARWRQPAVRAALWSGVLALGLGLLIQLTWIWRDTLAAELPASAPALRELCALAGCQVQALRRIDTLAVDSSGLNRLEGSPLYRLQLVLHNRAGTAVMMPALDLSVTDAQGQLVSRRVLQMAELGVAQSALQAGQELPIKVLLSTGERRIDGYTVELFYP